MALKNLVFMLFFKNILNYDCYAYYKESIF